MSEIAWKSEWNTFSQFYFFFEAPGHSDFKVHIYQVSQNMSFFQLPKMPFSWSVHKLQRARLRLLYPIAYPSSKHALDLNTERQCKQLPSDLSQDMQASPVSAVTKHCILFFCEMCTSTIASILHSKPTPRFIWRTRHLVFDNRYASQNSSQWNISEVCPFHDRNLIHHQEKHPKFISTLLHRFTWEDCTLKWVFTRLQSIKTK